MNTDEGMLYAALKMENADDKASLAADRTEAAAQRIALILEDGYGGNGLRLIEALERAASKESKP